MYLLKLVPDRYLNVESRGNKENSGQVEVTQFLLSPEVRVVVNKIGKEAEHFVDFTPLQCNEKADSDRKKVHNAPHPNS